MSGEPGSDWEFWGYMDRRWDDDPCAPLDYYDRNACLTLAELECLCCYAADYELAGVPAPAGAQRRFGERMEAVRWAAVQVEELLEGLRGKHEA